VLFDVSVVLDGVKALLGVVAKGSHANAQALLLLLRKQDRSTLALNGQKEEERRRRGRKKKRKRVSQEVS